MSYEFVSFFVFQTANCSKMDKRLGLDDNSSYTAELVGKSLACSLIENSVYLFEMRALVIFRVLTELDFRIILPSSSSTAASLYTHPKTEHF